MTLKTFIRDFIDFLSKKKMLALLKNLLTTIFTPDQSVNKRESQYYHFQDPSTQNISLRSDGTFLNLR